MATINISQTLIVLSNVNSLKNLAKGAAIIKLKEAKKELINNFNNHPVTQELKAGPTSSNISSTLGGYGNLASFIGLPNSSEAIGKVEQKLEEIEFDSSDVKITEVSRRKINYRFNTNTPTIKELEEITPYPSEKMSGSWLTGISKNITGILHYLYKSTGELARWSRSGTAIQAKEKIDLGSWSPVPYIKELLDKFTARIKK